MHEDLQFDVGHRLVNGTDLGYRQFTSQDGARETQLVQQSDFLHRTVVHLRGGMEDDGRQVESQQTHVLYDEGIHPGIVELPRQLLRGFQFVVTQDGVESHHRTASELMPEVGQPCNVLHLVSCRRTGAETGCSDIHGIGPMTKSLYSYLGIPCGRQQFDWLHYLYNRL